MRARTFIAFVSAWVLLVCNCSTGFALGSSLEDAVLKGNEREFGVKEFGVRS